MALGLQLTCQVGAAVGVVEGCFNNSGGGRQIADCCLKHKDSRTLDYNIAVAVLCAALFRGSHPGPRYGRSIASIAPSASFDEPGKEADGVMFRQPIASLRRRFNVGRHLQDPQCNVATTHELSSDVMLTRRCR
ncbi:hypothetical protein J6590_046051 [Homalodisca vitripennis]|nr:hypothetical protein J6590_046051 [Homalodisca vitripennis]